MSSFTGLVICLEGTWPTFVLLKLNELSPALKHNDVLVNPQERINQTRERILNV